MRRVTQKGNVLGHGCPSPSAIAYIVSVKRLVVRCNGRQVSLQLRRGLFVQIFPLNACPVRGRKVQRKFPLNSFSQAQAPRAKSHLGRKGAS